MADARADGWHDLPGGGAVEIDDGIPVRITDKGRWNLDEDTILAEAAGLTGMQLTWTWSRGPRWRRNGLLAMFRRGTLEHWRLARVLVGVCELCGDEVGVRWMKVTDGTQPGWVGESCARDSPEVVHEHERP